MKTHSIKKYGIGILIFLCCATFEMQAQNRGGFGGFGGFGRFGGFGGFGADNSSSSSEYNNNGTVGTATISVDPDTHNIIVIADADTAEQISNVIAHLDHPIPQVLIKVVFLEVQLNNSSDIGVEGGWTGAAGNSTVNAGNIFGLSGLNSMATNFNFNANNGISPSSTFPIPSSSSTLASGGLYQILGTDFQATLRAIAQAGKVQILSRPSILARDGQLANVFVGENIFLPSGVSLASVGNSTTTVPEINGSYTQVGINLSVTPFIGANNLVEMILQPYTSSVDTSSPGQVISGGSLFSSAVYAPNIDIRSANTVVVTPNAQTVVIGGLIGNNESSSESKIPILGDIPVIGNLFKTKSKDHSKDELMIFLTPHIVRAATQLRSLTGREMSQAPSITNSISEQELDRFLERIPVKKNH
jgi:general secretion pathway protein D